MKHAADSVGTECQSLFSVPGSRDAQILMRTASPRLQTPILVIRLLKGVLKKGRPVWLSGSRKLRDG